MKISDAFGLPEKGGSRSGQALSAVSGFVLLLGLACLAFGFFISTSPAQFPLVTIVALFIFVVAFFRMDVAIILVIIAMLFSPEITVASLPRRNVVIRIEDILIIVLGMAWLARSAVHKGAEILPRTAINGYIGFYCVSFFISTAIAIIVSGINPLKALFYILKYLEYFILFFLAAGTIRHKKTLYAYLLALMLTFVCVNIYATSQIGVTGRVSAPFEGEQGEPNTLGGYQVLMLCVTLGLFCHARTRGLSFLLGAIALMTLWPFLNTLSRASYVALVPAYIMLIVYNRSPKRNFLIVVLFVSLTLGLLFMPQKVRDRISYTFKPQVQENIPTAQIMGVQLDPSSSARMADFKKAVYFWRKAPFFGYGLTGMSFLDSQYINNLIELGAIGFLAFAFMIGMLHREVLRVYHGADDWVVKGLALGFASGNVGMLVHALTANTFILIRVMEPYWLIAAMILICPRLEGGTTLASVDKRRGIARRNVDMFITSPGQAPGRVDAT